jgi:transcriptional regulator with GAF, ATPase, and Fis domain
MLLVQTRGEWNGAAKLNVPLQSDGVVVGQLSLGDRKNGTEYTVEDSKSIEEIGALVARAVSLSATRVYAPGTSSSEHNLASERMNR